MKMSERDALAETISFLRRRAGLKQKDLADRARISLAHMSRIERAKVEAKRPTLQRIAAAFGLSLAEFHAFSEELARKQVPEPPPKDVYPPFDATPRRQPAEVAEEAKKLEYFLGLDDENGP